MRNSQLVFLQIFSYSFIFLISLLESNYSYVRSLPSYSPKCPGTLLFLLFFFVFFRLESFYQTSFKLTDSSPLILVLLSNSSTKFCMIGSVYFVLKFFFFIYIFYFFLDIYYPFTHAGHIFLYLLEHSSNYCF